MTKLLNAQRRHIARSLVAATFAERELRLKQREHALALRILRRELGDDILQRIAAVPAGWLPMASAIYLKTDIRRPVRFGSRGGAISFAESMPFPASVTHYGFEVGAASLDEYADFVRDEGALAEEKDQIERQVAATLAAFTTVERLAEAWPEGYAHFPHATLATPGLPATRIEDLNLRLAAAKEAA